MPEFLPILETFLEFDDLISSMLEKGGSLRFSSFLVTKMSHMDMKAGTLLQCGF